MYNAVDSKKPALCVFLDLEKAFDTVCHKQLLLQLERIGFRGITAKLFKSYLENRKLYVKINNTLSEPGTVHYGVPQGTVLGPIFFIIHINSILTSNFTGKLISFADDSAIFYESDSWNSLKNIVERDIKQLKNHFDNKKLSINYNKTFFLPLTSYKNKLPHYKSIKIKTNNTEIEIKSTSIL